MIGPAALGLSSFRNQLEKLSVLSLRKSWLIPPPVGLAFEGSKLSYFAKGSQATTF